MNLFFSFWIMLNYLFWFYTAATMKDSSASHLYAALFLGTFTGVLPAIIYYTLRNI